MSNVAKAVELHEFSEQAVSLASNTQQNSKTPWLADVREKGLATFKRMPFPTRKTEAWKYTSLRALSAENFHRPAQQFSIANAEALFEVEGLEALRVVFVNGEFNAELSSPELLSTSGLNIIQFADANESQQKTIKTHLANVSETERNLFTALNAGLIDNGLLITVDKKVRIERPVQLVHISSQQPENASVFARCLVVLEQQAELTLIEQFVSTHETLNTIFNQTSEFIIGDAAKLNHYRLHLEDESSIHLGGVYVDLNRDSQFESYQLALGGKVKRLDVLVNHNQPGSHCEMKGVYLPKHEQQVDFHTYIEHKAAHCTTDEVYRGIMADKSKAVFNGRIHIHPDAQKTLAELSNKNLLLSNQAEINTKPELEIYADDVRCAHGATVAQLDAKARFYLQSRGISRQEAEIMLSFGFINELLDAMPLVALRDKLRPLLAQQFTSNAALTRHLLDKALAGEGQAQGVEA